MFSTLELKAAALTEGIINVHPFVDANKRTGIMAGMTMLQVNGRTPVVSAEELYDVAIEIEDGRLTLEGLADWMLDYSKVLPLTSDEMLSNAQLFDPDSWVLDQLDT